MAKQTINLGTGELTGDGESIRSAFDKINNNFDELYATEHDLSSISQSIIPDTDVAYDLGSASNRFRDLYLSGSTIDLGGTTLSIVGGELQLGGVKVPTTTDVAATVASAVSAPTGDLTGSVFADDSTLLVDGVAGKIVGAIDTAQQAIFKDSIVIQNGNDIVTLGDGYGASFQLPNKSFSILGGGVGGGSYNIAFTANGSGSILATNQFNILGGSSIHIGTATGLTINNTVTVDAAVTAPSFVGDVTGSVFADDSGVMVDAVNNKLYAETLTTLAVFGNPTLALNADVIALDAQSGNLTLQTTNRIINNFGSAWEVQGTAASMVLNDFGGLPSELSVNIDVVDFGTGNTVDLQGNSVLFDSASIQDFAPGNIYANSGQYLYVTGKYSGGSATNVAFTYDAGNNRPRQTFYGKTEFGNNGAAPIVDFDGTTIENWTDPNVVNTANNSAQKIVVGLNTAVMDFLTVRVAENTPGELDVEFNYDAGGTVAVSANGDVANRFSGTTNFTAGNTTWTAMNTLTTIGDKGEFTIVDHSGYKIYRVTTFAGVMPGVNPGEAHCVIERLK